MPEFFREWLLTLTPKQKDEMWNYFDGSFTVDQDVTEIVGCADGFANDPDRRKAEMENTARNTYPKALKKEK